MNVVGLAPSKALTFSTSPSQITRRQFAYVRKGYSTPPFRVIVYVVLAAGMPLIPLIAQQKASDLGVRIE